MLLRIFFQRSPNLKSQSRRSPKKLPQRTLIHKLASPLVISGLMAAGNFQLIPQALAAGTAANTQIRNTATATYEDPNGVELESISNEITITVAEVAGLTNIAQAPTDLNGNSVVSGDILQFPFNVTNTGNASTGIFIPLSTNIASTNLTKNPGTYIDTDGDGVPNFFLEDNGILNAVTTTAGVYSPGAPVTIGPGVTPTFFPGAGWVIPNIVADATITIIVQGTVNNAASGQVSVTLGNTGPNDGSPASQNQPDNSDSSNNDEVRTVKLENGAIESATAVNGNREAADTSEPLTIGQNAPRPLALATVLKSVSSINPGTNPDITDDVITYNLSFRVERELPSGYEGNFTPAGLRGTQITVNGTAGEYVLVSDARPSDADFVLTTPPIAPTGWTIVYTAEALTTAALDARWYDTSTAALNGAGATSKITRVGFIRSTAAPNAAIPAGTIVTGFTLQATNAQNPTVRNLAQIFGQTNGDPDNNIVFDESGDQNPNNFLGENPSNGNPYGDYDPATDLGNAAEEDGSDPYDDRPNDGGGNDTEKGEPNELDLNNIFQPQPANLLNGPGGTPGAVGPTNNNDDFVEKSITEPATLGQAVPDPVAVIFNNSVSNGSVTDFNNVVLRPISPTEANLVCATCDYGSVDVNGGAIDIPDGTTVTITLGGQSATYTWNDDTAPGTGTFDLTTGTQVSIATLTAGQTLNYTVTVDLPGASAFDAYSIPVIAYVNNDQNNTFDADAERLISNIKVDRLYAGYLKLNKEVRVRYSNGTTSNFVADASIINPAPGPGDTLEYRITYTNIATPAPSGGSGNTLLPANNVVVEDSGISGTAGDTGTGNNWALDNGINGVIDTSHAGVGTAIASAGAIQFFNGNPAVLGIQQTGTTASTDVTQYINNVGTVNPGGTGTFTFQRRIN
ncbi:hypothetical protein NIES970_28270 (plasmid) [[Synechococcus] sp. NIES-970]|nr:hypothetical protein NIES970_28270 [[Synechococcus] sp. NIES-970]